VIGGQITGQQGTTYIVFDEIGRGGFGVVYLVKDAGGKTYALKLLAPADDASVQRSFEQEIESVAGLSHENVLPIVDHGVCAVGPRQGLFSVMPYCPDGDYRRVLAARTQPADVGEVVAEMQQILSGLQALHTRIIHRDLKPENILRMGSILKIGDFGLARFVDEATRTLTFKRGGTPLYMAPEVWLAQRATPATDLYALGVIVFEAVTGKLPFEAPSLDALRDQHLYRPAPRAKSTRSDLPDALDGIVKKLLAKESRERFQSAREVLDALRITPHAGEPAIAELAARARKHHDSVEAAALAAQQREQQARDLAALNRYKEEELAALVDDVVAEVNTHLVETKIIAMSTRLDRAWQFGDRVLRLHFFGSQELYRNPKVPGRMDTLRKRFAVHGGYLEIQENGEDREGWNLVLVRPPDSTYGEWRIVETRANPLVPYRFRYEPAATKAQLFADNLACHWMPAMHSFSLTDKPLERADIVKILGALIPGR
jgi:eukaryotic-like serine/threonine-protein kinase